jgi:hypothetical protein
LKKLSVAVARSVGRTTAEPAIQRSPTVTPPSSSSGGGSAGRIRRRSAPEPRNEKASRSSAPGAVRAWTRNPATVGPATNEKARLPLSSELASTKRSRGTIVWKRDASATPKSTVRDPARNATTYSCSSVKASRTYASGTVAITAARPTSVAIIVRRRCPRRSTHAPACSARRRFGARAIAVR